MKKKIYKLTENDLHNIIMKTVNQYLTEEETDDIVDYSLILGEPQEKTTK